MNPITGLRMLLVSICPPAPTAMIAIDPSTPTFQPSVRWKSASAASVMNMMIADRAFAIFTANSEARLDDGREDQDCHRLVGKLPPRPDLPEEVFERRAHAGV